MQRADNVAEIQKWAEKSQGKPRRINDPTARGDAVGIRIDFPGMIDEAYLPENETQPISWEEFDRILQESHMSFYYDPDSRGPGTVKKPAYRFIKQDRLNPPTLAVKEKVEAVVKQLWSRDEE